MNPFQDYLRNYNQSFGESKRVLTDAFDPSFQDYPIYDRAADVASGLFGMVQSPFEAAEKTFLEDPIVSYAVSSGADEDNARAYTQMGLLGAGLLMGGMNAMGKADDIADVARKMVLEGNERKLADLYPAQRAKDPTEGLVLSKESSDDVAKNRGIDVSKRKLSELYPKQRGALGGVNADRAPIPEGGFPDNLSRYGEIMYWEEKGWYKGNDGKWRFEIDDSKSKLKSDELKGTGLYKLGDILEHDELYDNYPELKSLDVFFNPEIRKPGGSYLPYVKEDGKFIAPEIEITGKTDPKDIHSTLLHEVQHGIQQMEDFARGGSSELAGTLMRSYEEGIPRLADEIHAAAEAGDTSKAKKLQRKLDRWYNVWEHGFEGGEIPTWEAYKRLVGETEARNVQKRMWMSAQEKKMKSPIATQDRTNKEQIPLRHEWYGRWLDEI